MRMHGAHSDQRRYTKAIFAALFIVQKSLVEYIH